MLRKSKNRTFNYKPRFSNENLEDNGISSEKKLVSQWKSAHNQSRKAKAVLPISALILLLVLLLIGMYVLDSYIN